jgi:hypothetical protein
MTPHTAAMQQSVWSTCCKVIEWLMSEWSQILHLSWHHVTCLMGSASGEIFAIRTWTRKIEQSAVMIYVSWVWRSCQQETQLESYKTMIRQKIKNANLQKSHPKIILLYWRLLVDCQNGGDFWLVPPNIFDHLLCALVPAEVGSVSQPFGSPNLIGLTETLWDWHRVHPRGASIFGVGLWRCGV